MSRKRQGERVLGPYEENGLFRIVQIDAAGRRESVKFESEAKALRYMELLLASLDREEHTTETALDAYETFLGEKGNKERSTVTTLWSIREFFPTALPLQLLSAKRCEAHYLDLRTRLSERTKKPMSADTHRNVLAQTKSFLAWCVAKGWLRENPCEKVKGIGKRRPRGKSLGLEGNTLRVKEARAWYLKALELAERGDVGATAALVALLLGMRASEITSRRVRDLDEDEAPGDLLWIPCSKTPAGRRTLEVPEVLRPLLVRCAKDKHRDAFLFQATREGPTSKDPETPEAAAREALEGRAHWRDWIIGNVRRICQKAGVPEVTAHALRGLLATLTAERGLAGHLIAATLGHEDERTTMHAYAAPGAAAAGANRRGLVLLEGGLKAGAEKP
ncbi:MAG: site-specific integrase [Deltaproteobacteria bacterium]|nr:site-specific integrase [Deltaproteobacteria bacterium]